MPTRATAPALPRSTSSRLAVASYDLRLPDGTTRTVLLAKPQSYMNTSGGPLSKLMRAEHITPAELLVIHDEVDLPAGEVRAKWGGGLNAHNGLRSIASKLGTNDFGRIRFGIGRPPGRMDVADFVLSVPKKEAADDFAYAVDRAAQATLCLISEGLEKAQQQFN